MPIRFGMTARIGLGLAVSALCLWLALRQVPLYELFDTLAQVNYRWLLPSVIGNILVFVPRGYRWRALLANRGTASEYFWAQAIGALLTNVFPLRAGEAGRVVIISRRIGLPLVHVGASLVLERAADLIVVLGLLAALLLIMDVPWAIAATAVVLAGATALALWLVAMMILFGRRLTPVAQMLAKRLPERAGVLGFAAWINVLDALEPMRNARVVAQVAAWTAMIWIVLIVTLWTTIEAVVPGARLIEATFALAAIAVGISLPSSPGFIGVFQFVGQQALVTPFPDRFTPSSALTVALLFHLVAYVISMALGAIGLARLGLSLRTVRDAEVVTPPTPIQTPMPSAAD
jgi:uncharacterized membrane protein YbhN (UPF0104 family)